MWNFENNRIFDKVLALITEIWLLISLDIKKNKQQITEVFAQIYESSCMYHVYLIILLLRNNFL